MTRLTTTKSHHSTRRMLAGGFILALASMAPAQVRLDDVFSGNTPAAAPVPGSTVTTRDLDQNPAAAEQLLTSMEADLAAGAAPAALRKADLLAAWLSKEAPSYERLLWLRARACEGIGEAAQLRELARLYLQKYPKGQYRLWFLVRAAEQLEGDGNLRDAATMWRRVVDEKLAPEPADAVRGAALLLRLADGAGCRALLKASNAPANDQRAWLELESLLVQDDATIAVPSLPAGAGAGVALRHGLLLELRGQRDAAQASYRLAKAGELGAQERNLLEQRVR